MYACMHVMDNIYSNRSKAGEGLYSRLSIGRLEGELRAALDASWDSHNNVYLGHRELQHLPTSYNLSALWNDFNHQELLFYGPNATDRRSTTLWRLGNAFLRRSFELHHRHSDIARQLGSLAASDQYKYIHSNGLFELFQGYSSTLNAFVYQAVDTSNTINRLQLVLLVIEGCCICALVVAYMAWLLRKVDNQRYGMYGVFLIVPVGLVRGLASKTVAVEEENSDGEEEHPEELAADDLGGGLGAMAAACGSTWMPAVAGRGVAAGGLAYLHPWQLPGEENLPSPASAPVAMTNVVNTVLTRLHRVVYFAQELAIAGGVEAQQALYPILQTDPKTHPPHHKTHPKKSESPDPQEPEFPHPNPPLDPLPQNRQSEVAALKSEWEVMLYGANSTQATDPHFALARRGVAFEMGPATNTLFASGMACWTPDASDCYPPEHPYAAVVYRGLNAMMQRFFVESDLMLRDAPSAWQLNSSRLDYLFHEGTGNLHWAMFRLTEVHLESVVALYMRVEVFHVVVFVLSWLLAGLFLFGMLRPFMGHTQRETERIAEMLSQLPADVDVEGLLNKALISIKGEVVTPRRVGDQRTGGRNRVVPLSAPFEGEPGELKGGPRPLPSFTKGG
ncbi:hypothetical protein VOLCADRAFT_94888 [Volvox carteri f. nagariensis]|uniref:Uncharacterized protein n=1 Tax=Volvox carteri f. nagariensis TaxID=3068 RepID=D8U617_VOLCA|nr:uncharacterized protein VOLCADRAFT_94888 [Volvox carteri f. nagariensis]EFJ44860.1 hypothetical protein VOLCADRAFT_94888 [Volvox carteri f. nagariensis]|eukprot:XP_002954143.1 hypothetical protein VOLCADRAFT_94888 [Volvox carteri f. nagariensis]